jgi:hypothetical protein
MASAQNTLGLEKTLGRDGIALVRLVILAVACPVICADCQGNEI